MKITDFHSPRLLFCFHAFILQHLKCNFQQKGFFDETIFF